MRVGLVAGNPIEWLLDKFGLLPRAMLETFHGAAQARTIMVAAKLGIFEALAAGPRSTEQLAAATGSNIQALEKLLRVLAASRYLTLRHDQWKLRRNARHWIPRSSRHSITDNLLHAFAQWRSLENLEHFILTGEPIEIHNHLPPDDWAIYQSSMKSIAQFASFEIVRQVRLPPEPKRMLDIGGSHGAYSVAFCRRFPTLEAVVMDLPAAVEQAAPLLASAGMGSRVVHRAGDALIDSLGEREWDFVFVSQLLHHFTAQVNQDLCGRIARSLKPGGAFVISEIERSSNPKPERQLNTIFDLYFAATSQSGTWSVEQIQSWQATAGLTVNPPTRLWTIPDGVLMPSKAPAI